MSHHCAQRALDRGERTGIPMGDSCLLGSIRPTSSRSWAFGSADHPADRRVRVPSDPRLCSGDLPEDPAVYGDCDPPSARHRGRRRCRARVFDRPAVVQAQPRRGTRGRHVGADARSLHPRTRRVAGSDLGALRPGAGYCASCCISAGTTCACYLRRVFCSAAPRSRSIGPLVAIYGLLTCIALHQRRESWRSYGFLVAGGLLPCFYFVWLARDPTAVHNILVHYQQGNIGVGLLAQAARSASLYWDFWSPEFLLWRALPVTRALPGSSAYSCFRWVACWCAASLLLRGACRRRQPCCWVPILQCTVSGEFVGRARDLGGLWRLRHSALLAAYGLYRLLEGETARVRSTVFVATFALSISVAVT